MLLFLWRWWQARRKQKQLNAAYWTELYRDVPNLDELRALLQAGANVNGGEGGGNTALNFAITYPAYMTNPVIMTETVRFLIENGADVQGSLYSYSWTPLSTACYRGRGLIPESTAICCCEESVRLLINAGSDVTASEKEGGYGLLCGLTEWASTTLIEDLLKCGASSDREGLSSLKPLHLAAYGGRAEVTALYLRYGANPCARDEKGRTPRMIAEEGETQLLQLWRTDYVPDFAECARLLLAAEQEYTP